MRCVGKFLVYFLSFLILCSGILFGFEEKIVFPDGTELFVSYENKWDPYKVILLRPAFIKTSVGKLKVPEGGRIHFSGKDFKVLFCDIEPTEIETSLGKLTATSVSFYDLGNIRRLFLYTNHSINVKAGDIEISKSVWFFSDSISVNLVEDTYLNTPVGRLKFSTNGELSLFLDGDVSYGKLSEPQIINTSLGNLKVSEHISFFKDGNIKEVFLAEPQYVNTKFGKLMLSFALRLYNNGLIQECYSYPYEIISTPYGKLKFKEISFFENGNIRLARLESSAIIIPAGKLNVHGWIYFYESGEIEAFLLSTNQAIKTKLGNLVFSGSDPDPCGDSGVWISFYKEGILKSGYLAKTHTIKTKLGVLEAKGFISFYKNGDVREIFVGSQVIKTPLGNIKAIHVEFYKSGALKSILLGEKVKIGQKIFYPEDKIFFSKEGKLIHKAEDDEEYQEYEEDSY